MRENATIPKVVSVKVLNHLPDVRAVNNMVPICLVDFFFNRLWWTNLLVTDYEKKKIQN